MIKIFLYFSIFLLIESVVFAKTDSLEKLINLQLASEPKLETVVLINELMISLRETEPKKALDYGKKALKIAGNFPPGIEMSNTYNRIGNVYFDMGIYDKSIEAYFNSLRITRDREDWCSVAWCYNDIGFVYNTQGLNKLALSYFFKAIDYSLACHYEYPLGHTYGNIGLIFKNMKKYDSALTYYQKSLIINKRTENKYGYAQILNYIGKVYTLMDNFPLADKYLNDALTIFRSIKHEKMQAYSMQMIGDLYFAQKDYSKALSWYFDALAIFTKFDDKNEIALLKLDLANVNQAIGRYEIALNYAKSCLQISEEESFITSQQKANDLISKIYFQIGDYKEAFNYRSQLDRIKDTNFNSMFINTIYDLEIHNRVEKQELELKHIQESKMYIQFFVAALVLVFVLASVFLTIRYRTEKKLNILLSDKNIEIIEKQNQLEDTLEELKMSRETIIIDSKRILALNEKLIQSEENLLELNRKKDKFFSIIAHDLRNPIQSILLGSFILKSDVLKMTRADLKKHIEGIDSSIRKLADLLENLLQWSRSQLGNLKSQPENFDLSEITNETIDLFLQTAERKDIVLYSEVAEQTNIYADINMVKTIIRNLVSNALKFTPRGGEIKITANENKENINISVADNGVGIKQEDLRKLFRIDSGFSSQGTEEESGTGLGLILCKDFVEKMNGQIWVDSIVGKGTSFSFSLPKIKTQS